MKKYCPECGFSNEYSLNEPQNCSKCKKSMSFSFAPQKTTSNVKAPKKNTPINTEEEYIDESEVEDYNLSLKSISVDLGAVQKFTLKDIQGQKPTGITREKGNIDKKTILSNIGQIMSQKNIEIE